ncbi:response regulator transcription factor [Pedobacter montanisoli]|uniref:DNA-binding response regulator n=1 Tax=Pedobacter montanisoli TaxID=2923277 RepID=A0ABS9ZVI6_9SPHI|nr:DNA-binding response regulator [Pedobacter montanisoli]MCJ0741854.1 DNA-binding response regulator [Pedobacter montanisoli]
MRILIIEDEIVIARFIEQQVQNISSAFEIAIAISVDEVEHLFPDFIPQLVICDIELNDKLDGIELLRQLKVSHTFETVFITSYKSMNMINRAFEIEPLNYIIKPLDENRLYAGILPAIKKIKENLPQPAADLNETISQSELNILRLIAQQKTTPEIASILNLSPYTIKNHRHNICRKLRLNDETNALLKWSLKNQHLLAK